MCTVTPKCRSSCLKRASWVVRQGALPKNQRGWSNHHRPTGWPHSIPSRRTCSRCTGRCPRCRCVRKSRQSSLFCLWNAAEIINIWYTIFIPKFLENVFKNTNVFCSGEIPWFIHYFSSFSFFTDRVRFTRFFSACVTRMTPYVLTSTTSLKMFFNRNAFFHLPCTWYTELLIVALTCNAAVWACHHRRKHRRCPRCSLYRADRKIQFGDVIQEFEKNIALPLCITFLSVLGQRRTLIWAQPQIHSFLGSSNMVSYWVPPYCRVAFSRYFAAAATLSSDATSTIIVSSLPGREEDASRSALAPLNLATNCCNIKWSRW